MKSKNLIYTALVLLIGITLNAQNGSMAWGWYGQPQEASVRLSNRYVYANGVNGAIQGERIKKGYYKVTIPNMGAGKEYGIPHVTAYGGRHIAQIATWKKSDLSNNVDLYVRTFDAKGQPVDGRFTFQYLYGGKSTGVSAAMFNSDRSERVSNYYSYNTSGAVNKVEYVENGLYKVYFPGIKKKGSFHGSLIVTAQHLTKPIKATVKTHLFNEEGMVAQVQLADKNGMGVRGNFTVSFDGDHSIGTSESDYFKTATVRFVAPDSPRNEYHSNFAKAEDIFVRRYDKGVYVVNLPFNNIQGITTNVVAAPFSFPFGGGGNNVHILKWGAHRSVSGMISIDVLITNEKDETVDGDFELRFISSEKTQTTSTISNEDCEYFESSRMRVVQREQYYDVVENGVRKFSAENRTDAERVIEVLNHYEANQICYVGKGTGVYVFTYLLNNGSAPSFSLEGDKTVKFNPDNLTLEYNNGEWMIVEGQHWVRSFANSKKNARTALNIIKKHGFNKIHYVGKYPSALMYCTK